MPHLYVINSRGKRTLFSLRKVYNSCRRSGASKTLSQKISQQIEKNIYPDIRTSEISKLVKQFLLKTSPKSSMKFSLKEAMRKLGPSGFDFEKYIGEILLRNGFKVKINQRISGFCVSYYEIDFLAKKGNSMRIGECKYHRLPGARIDLKVALYNYARFLDILKGSHFKNLRLKPILVTNTKFTKEVIRYSKCMKVELLGWRYPPRKGLESLIENLNLYPITILPSFKGYFKEIFAAKRIMLALDLLEIPSKKLAKKLRLPLNKIENLTREAKILLE